jgi:hypothetical protein
MENQIGVPLKTNTKKKKKKQKRQPGDPIPYASIPPRGPPIKITIDDSAYRLYQIDHRILGLLHTQYQRFVASRSKDTRRLGISAEIILERLNAHNELQKSKHRYTLQNVWDSLDQPVMRRYVYRKNRLLWALVTEGQVEKQQQLLLLGLKTDLM